MMKQSRSAESPKSGRQARDPDAARGDIVRVAIREFADKGLAGARIDEIASKTRTSKRMIYYYFGSKEQLYVAALEEIYATLRMAEASLALDDMSPVEALRSLTAETYDFKERYPDFVRLVMAENINKGRYVRMSDSIKAQNASAALTIERIYKRGVKSGDFRVGIDPMEIYFMIAALSFFPFSNQYTFFHIFRQKMKKLAQPAYMRETIVDSVMKYVAAEPSEDALNADGVKKLSLVGS